MGVVSAVHLQPLPRQHQRLLMPQPWVRRQRHQHQAASQRQRRSLLGDSRLPPTSRPLPTLWVTPEARPAPTPCLHQRRWRWCSSDGSGQVQRKKLCQSPSPACCPAPTRSLVTLGQQFCGSGRCSRPSTSASATGAPSWRSIPGRRPANSSLSDPNLSGTVRSTKRTSRRCMPGSWRRTGGRRRWPEGRRSYLSGMPSQQSSGLS
jgi:hypothetical protein